MFLIVASCAAFGRIAGNDFITLSDDRIYITENNYVKSGFNTESIKWAFMTTSFGYWHPLNLIFHILDWNLFGANPSGHHIVSLLLHIGAVILLFLFLNKTTNNIWPAAFAAALFALHPLRVESVAYAGELKDVLSMFFGMASIYAYAFYAESSKLSRYFLCLILFALALMSKPMLVTLPFVLMFLDYWPLKRWQKATVEPDFNSTGKLILEKVPFICLTIAVSIVSLWVHNKGGASLQSDYLPSLKCITNAILLYAAYLRKTFWPVHLAPVNLAIDYTYYYSLPLWTVLIFGIILILITLAVLYHIKTMPFLFVGWFWYLGTLVPIAGLIQLDWLVITDRYIYLPSVGIAIMLAWGIPLLFPSENMRKKILFPAGIVITIILTVLTWQQCGYLKNSIELWSHALKVTKNNAFGHNDLGLALFAEGKIEEAISHYNMAIRTSPSVVLPYACNNRGNAYAKLGQYQRAIADYNEAIRLNPNYAESYNNRGNTYATRGQYQRAIEDYNEAIRLKPDYVFAYNNRGNAYAKLGQYQRAIEDYNEAIRLKPDYVFAYNNRGSACYNLGQYQRAIANYHEAIRLKPDYAQSYNNRGVAYLNQGNKEQGCRDAQKACELGICAALEWAKGKGYCR